MAFLRGILRLVRRVVGSIFGNPFLTLAFLVLVIALLNYRTVKTRLPHSLSDVEAWFTEASPVTVTLAGAVEGAETCWEMQFTFLDAKGKTIVENRVYSGRIRQLRPEITIEVPDLDAYTITIVTELINAEAANHCVPKLGLVVMSASRMTVTTGDLPNRSRVANRCTHADNRFDCSVSYE